MIDLTAMFPPEPGRSDALGWFIGSCLCAGGVWESPRTSDGIQGIDRVFERAPDVLRVRGRIFEIDQALHAFWLELARHASGDRVAWSLYFDVAEASPRRARNALDRSDRPDDIEWRAKVTGEATVEGGVLTIVTGSTRVLVTT
jgi:hypothetical protein